MMPALRILPCACGAPGPHPFFLVGPSGATARCEACWQAEASQDAGQDLGHVDQLAADD